MARRDSNSGAITLCSFIVIGFIFSYFFLQSLEDDDQGRYHEYAQAGAEQHAADSARSDAAVTVGAHAAGGEEWQQPEDEGERGHEDGPQSCFAAFYSCFEKTHAF